MSDVSGIIKYLSLDKDLGLKNYAAYFKIKIKIKNKNFNF
jgi:hypothetical protein